MGHTSLWPMLIMLVCWAQTYHKQKHILLYVPDAISTEINTEINA